MTIRPITISSQNGPDRLMIVCRPGPAALERCSVAVSGDGSVEQAILERIGRRAVVTRSHHGEPWRLL